MKKRLKIPAFAYDSAWDGLSDRRDSRLPLWDSRIQAIEFWLLRKMLAVLGDPPLRLQLWDGRELTTSPESSVGLVRINSRAALHRLLRNPELQFGYGYAAGQIEIEGDLVTVLEQVYRSIYGWKGSSSPPERFLSWLYRPHAARPNTLEGSKQNIHRHYDIGNDFYRLWLDRQMVYTCAYYPTPSAALEEAQTAKMDHVCRKLNLQPGEQVIEAGCGWGALALHMARHYGVQVRAYNISEEQIRFARQRAADEGLEGRVEFIQQDYREISGRCDAFVSVGMLEHVGVDNYRTLGEVIENCLGPDGRGLIHTIGRNRPRRMNAWIEKCIFSGAYPPTLREMMEIFEPSGFSVLDVENLRLHYARTLRHWLQRYESVAGQVEKLFDQDFTRAWRLYLAGSIAAFEMGALQLFQVSFARAADNSIPQTRDYLYQQPAGDGAR